MVKITRNDLAPTDDIELLKYVSSDESDNEEKRFTEIESEITFSTKFDNVVILAELPKVPEEKIAKLKEVLTSRISKELIGKQVITVDYIETDKITGTAVGTAAGGVTSGVKDGVGKGEQVTSEAKLPFHLDLPFNEEEGTTVGVCFLTFRDGFEAKKAAQHLANCGVDSKHRFKLCRLDDFDSILESVPEEEQEERKEESEGMKGIGFDRTKLREWTFDALGREQYLYGCGSNVDIVRHDPLEREPSNIFSKRDRLGYFVAWSPQGSYLVVFHKRGIALAGDDQFSRKVRFTHVNARYVYFSPDEEYMITWDGSDFNSQNTKAVMVWKVLTGECLRTFPTPEFSSTGLPTKTEGSWPFLLFSHDSKYLAMRQDHGLAVFELPSMLLLQETLQTSTLGKPTANHSAPDGGVGSVAVRRTPLSYQLEMFEWSPSANVISIWVPEAQDSPGRLLLVDIPSRQEVASKNVFNVKYVSIYWQQPRGNFMALVTVIARKKGKKSRTESTQIEVFKVKQKSIPVDTLSIEGARVRGLYWEKGSLSNRFALIEAGDSSGSQTIKFYQVLTTGDKQDTELVESVTIPHPINCLEWSPAGQYFVAAVKGSEGTLIFGCLNELNKFELVQKDEYPDLTDVLWDPSGRFVCAAVLVPSTNGFKVGSSPGYRIFSFQGRYQYKYNDPKLSQFLWRPRPPSLLPPNKVDEVHRKLKEYSKKYDTQDELRRSAKKKAFRDEHSALIQNFFGKVNQAKEKLKTHEWSEGWKALDAKLDWQKTVQTIEEKIDTSREVIEKTS